MANASAEQLLELGRHRARAELVALAEAVLARRLARDAAEDHAVEQGVAAKTVVAVHATGDLARGVESRDHALGADALGKRSDLQAAHAVVDHRGDDGHVEGLGRHLGAGERVVVELLAAARLAARLVPGLAGRVRGEGPAIGVLLRLLRSREVIVVGLLEDRQGNTHVLGKRLTAGVELHDTAAGVVLAVPDDLIGRGLVQAETERRLVLPHLARHVVAAAELVGETLALRVEHDATHTTERLGGKELDLRIRIIRLHQPGGVHLHPLQIDALPADLLAHLDAVAGAVLAVRGRQVHQVRAVLRKEGGRGEVRSEATGRENDRAVLAEHLAALLVRAANARAGTVREELADGSLRDDPGLVRALADLLEHLDQGVGDRHAREALGTAVSARHRVAAETGKEGQVKVELLDEPVHIGAAVVAEDLHELRPLGAALQRVVGEDLVGVGNALGLLRLRRRTVDAARRLGRVAAAEGGLVQQDNLASVLQNGVRRRHAREAAAHHDGEVCWKYRRHG
mmetsp:Transcript_51062/g.111311  ORF Transcript_51062/g.111311 Transcript_51062/m.111311 type:complete len:514 (-) Transcript_51062:66-1607(-)